MCSSDLVSLIPILIALIEQNPSLLSSANIGTLADDHIFYPQLPDGRLLALPAARVRPILQVLIELYGTDRLIDGKLRLPILDAARLLELEEALKLRWFGGETVLELGRKLRDFSGIKDRQSQFAVVQAVGSVEFNQYLQDRTHPGGGQCQQSAVWQLRVKDVIVCKRADVGAREQRWILFDQRDQNWDQTDVAAIDDHAQLEAEPSAVVLAETAVPIFDLRDVETEARFVFDLPAFGLQVR